MKWEVKRDQRKKKKMKKIKIQKRKKMKKMMEEIGKNYVKKEEVKQIKFNNKGIKKRKQWQNFFLYGIYYLH